MTENENVPQLRFSGFDDEWEEKKLGEISSKVSKKNTDNSITETFTNSAEFGIISQRDFFDHDISNEENIDGYFIVENDDFVYNPRISTIAPVGPINRNKLGRSGVMSPLYYVFRTHDIDKSFLEKYFKSECWYGFMFLNGNSGARSDRFSITDSVFTQMPIRVPRNKLEQQKIGTFLSHVDSLIQAKTKKLESLKAVKKSLLQKCFPKAGKKVPEMRFTGFSGDWEEKKLGELAEISSGTTPSRMNSENFSGDVCWLTSGELKSHYIYDTSEKINESIAETMRTYKKGTVVIAIYGLEAAGIRGTCSILKRDCTISQACMAFTNLKSVHNEFLYCWYIANGNEIGTKYAQGTKQQNLSSDIVSDMSICFPTLAEQQKIGHFFSKYDSLISAQQKEIDKLKEVKKALLQKMFI